MRQHGNTVHIEIESHSHEDYKKAPGQHRAFAGKGHTLGSPAPNVVEQAPATAAGAGASGTTAAAKPAGSSNEDNEKRANEELKLNETAPLTTIQVRLMDGSRISTRFNHSHTVDDIRSYIITARPQYVDRTFNLISGFPSKPLTDGTATIEAAGLLNASILQR